MLFLSFPLLFLCPTNAHTALSMCTSLSTLSLSCPLKTEVTTGQGRYHSDRRTLEEERLPFRENVSLVSFFSFLHLCHSRYLVPENPLKGKEDGRWTLIKDVSMAARCRIYCAWIWFSLLSVWLMNRSSVLNRGLYLMCRCCRKLHHILTILAHRWQC